MPFLEIGAEAIEITVASEQEPTLLGTASRSDSGMLRSTVKTIRRNWTMTGAPVLQSRYETIRALLAGGAFQDCAGDALNGETVRCEVLLTGAGFLRDGIGFKRVLEFRLTEVGTPAVPPAPVATVAITPDPIAVDVGDTAAATIRTYAAGAVEVTGRAVTAAVTDPTKATVAPASGVSPLAVVLSGVAAGATVLTGTSETIPDTAAINVSAGGGGPILSDTFTRANNASAPGNAETGQAAQSFYYGTAPVWGISGNRLYLPTPSSTYAFLVYECGVADGTLSIKLYGWPGRRGLALRLTDANNMLLLEIDATGAALYRRQAGGYTQIGSSGGASVSEGDTLTAILSGSNITVQRNGATLFSATDSFNAAATLHGVASGNGISGLEYDDLEFV